VVDIAVSGERPIAPADVVALNAEIGWLSERTEADYATAVARCPSVGAWDEARLIGFARAITDGSTHAYIDDVMVHPAHRRGGLALALLDALWASLADVRTVTLFCDEDLVPLYERAGFERTSQVILHRHNPRR
jgi:ribosomal protein S18 acetylase RimI-like enzyme